MNIALAAESARREYCYGCCPPRTEVVCSYVELCFCLLLELLCQPEDTEGQMAPPFGGRAAREQGRAQAQATVTRAADGGDPGRSWSSLMYPRRPRDLRSANTRDPHREACGARGPAVWCPHRDTALPRPPPLLEHPHF